MRAGLAIVDITPPVGVRLSGFAGRPVPNFANTGVRDPLRATALYVDDGQQAAVVLALDTIGLTPTDDYALRQRIAAAVGCSADGVLIAASHTHSGACTMQIRATGNKETAWTRAVLAHSVGAAVEAKAQALPLIGARVGSQHCDAAVNRRKRTSDGVTIATNPEGIRDPACRTLTLLTDTGPLVTLFHYSCHPVALGNQNTRVSADWVAATRATAEPALGCPTLFLQGCCGDINPRFTPGEPRSEVQADRVGREVGEAILAADTHAALATLGPLALGGTSVQLPLLPHPGDATLATVETQARERLATVGRDDVAQAYLEWVESVRRHPAKRFIRARLSSLQLGPVTLLGLPGELFSEIGLDLCTAIPTAWTVGYANGNLGYLYPDSALDEGGYEVDVAFKLYGDQQTAKGTAAALHRGALLAHRRACRQSI